MFDIEQLKNKDFFAEIKKQYDKLAMFDDINKAYRLAKDLETSIGKIENFKDKHPELNANYKKIIYRLKWIGLPIMGENMALGMFASHFTEIFKIPGYAYDVLWQKLKTILLGIIIFEDRDKYKASIRNALLNNEEILTKGKIRTNNIDKETTIENWLKDYIFNVGSGAADNLEKTQYFINNENIKRLDENEKNNVRTLFNLFERLKLSSLTLEGLEEDIPVDEIYGRGIIEGGVVRFYKEEKFENQNKVPMAGNNYEVVNLQNMASQYPVGSLERKAIEEEIRKLESGIKS